MNIVYTAVENQERMTAISSIKVS